MGRFLLPALATTLFFAACRTPADRHTPPADSTNAATVVPTQPAPDSREALLAAVHRLEAQLADTTGGELASALDLPLPDSTLTIFSEDAGFIAARDAANGYISKPMFLTYFPQISESLDLPEFRELFRRIPVSRLQASDTANGDSRRKNDPCYQTYSIEVRGDTVAFSYGSDHNDNYVNSSDDEEGPICEWSTIWLFRFDGRELRFLHVYQAG